MWINAPSEAPKDKVGFVYMVKELDNRMIYIGCKRFWKTVKMQPLKGRTQKEKAKRSKLKGNKRHKLVETDWRDYKTSSPIMQKKIEDNPDNYAMTILSKHETTSDMKITEAYHQMSYYLNGRWSQLYNEVINLRVRIPKKNV